ncbi:hypothetical protein PIB30_022932 [Stylosanthes scabra]|uniref:Uncharacterized protein n=1 Tax=Stylosanthes scabra TaxID=79078 RepID=A0ABU6QA02_9FABA|nr:hypothetical protein [Stylosanthes scabra]
MAERGGGMMSAQSPPCLQVIAAVSSLDQPLLKLTSWRRFEPVPDLQRPASIFADCTQVPYVTGYLSIVWVSPEVLLPHSLLVQALPKGCFFGFDLAFQVATFRSCPSAPILVGIGRACRRCFVPCHSLSASRIVPLELFRPLMVAVLMEK